MESWYTVHTPKKQTVKFVCRGDTDRYYEFQYHDRHSFLLSDSQRLPEDAVQIAKQGWQHHWLDLTLYRKYQHADPLPENARGAVKQSSVLWMPEEEYIMFRHSILDISTVHIRMPKSVVRQTMKAMTEHGLILPPLPKNLLDIHADRSNNLRELLQRRSH